MSVDKHITNAGLLLSDQGILNQSRIFCTRWNGLVKGNLSDAIDDKEYTGSIIFLLQSAEAFIINNTKNSWKIDGMKRIETEEYPQRAIREAIVNAIIHRDYQITGSEIHIDIFDDRLEITSPGGMIDGSFIQNLDITKIPSIRRNRIISDIFNQLHFMERRGSGLIRMLESYSNSDKKPIFYSDISSFKVIFPNLLFKDIKLGNGNTVNNIVNDEDYFIIKLYKNIPSGIRRNTIEQLITIFNVYTFKLEFKREDIEKLLNVKKTRANDIIKLLQKSNLVELVDNNKYQFKK